MSSTTAARVSDKDDLAIHKFYLPPASLTIRIADRIEALETEATPSSADSPSEIVLQQHLLAEELETCLADASETHPAMKGKKLHVEKTITEGMSDALGLLVNDGVLAELATDFRNWIDHLGSFTAPWGQIISIGDGYMYLTAFPQPEDIANESSLHPHL